MKLSKHTLRQAYATKSLQEIATSLHCSLHKVKYWIDKYEIPKRTRSQAMYLKLNPHGDPFQIKTLQTKDDMFLYGLGLGIYMGEGTKATPHTVRVTNSDPEIIKLFILFLKDICGVQNSKIRFSLICFHDNDPDDVARHWGELLEISSDKFGKIVQVPTQGKGTYRKKSQFGVCSVTVSNIHLKDWIMQKIKETGKAWVA